MPLSPARRESCLIFHRNHKILLETITSALSFFNIPTESKNFTFILWNNVYIGYFRTKFKTLNI